MNSKYTSLDSIASLQSGSSLSSFDIYKKIGAGAVGKVYLAKHKRTATHVAIKTVLRTAMDERRIVDEIIIHRGLCHPNILKMAAFFFDAEKAYLVMQFAPNGSLFDLRRSKGVLPDQEARKYIHETAQGLAYLHTQRIIHRDLKSENVLLSPSMRALISDFGWSARTADGEQRCTVAGTPIYLSPEQTTLPIVYNESVDLWCLGTLAFEMLCGYTPFENSGGSMRKLGEQIRRCIYQTPKHVSPQAEKFIRGLVEKDPQKRMSMQGVLAHPWISEADSKEKEDDELLEEVKPEMTVAMALGNRAVAAKASNVREFMEILEKEFEVQRDDIHCFTVNKPKVERDTLFTGITSAGKVMYLHLCGEARELVFTKKQMKSKSGPMAGIQLASDGIGGAVIAKASSSFFGSKSLPKVGEKLTRINGDPVENLSLHEIITKLSSDANTPTFTLSLVSPRKGKKNSCDKSLGSRGKGEDVIFKKNGDIQMGNFSQTAANNVTIILQKKLGVHDSVLSVMIVDGLKSCVTVQDSAEALKIMGLTDLDEKCIIDLMKASIAAD